MQDQRRHDSSNPAVHRQMGPSSSPSLGCSINGPMAIRRRRRNGLIWEPRSGNSRKLEFDLASHWTTFQSCHRMYVFVRGDFCTNVVCSDKRAESNDRGPTAWVYVSEIFPLKYRAKANGLCAATNCMNLWMWRLTVRGV